MRKRRAGVIGMLMIGLAALAWVFAATDRTPVHEAAAAGSASAHSAAAAHHVTLDAANTPEFAGPMAQGMNLSSSSKPGSNDAPLPVGPFAQIRPALEARARAGDGRAAAYLARIYFVCREVDANGVATPNRVHEAPFMRVSSDKDPLFKPVPQAVLDQTWVHNQSTRHRLCAGIVSLPPDQNALLAHWHWLKVAADDGNVEAMVDYANWVVASYPAVEGRKREWYIRPLGHAEDIARYQEQAIDYLQRAFQLGSPRAVRAYARQYAGGSLFELDPVRAAAYVMVWRGTSAMQNPVNRQLSWYMLSTANARLDPTQRQQAQALAKEIGASFHERPMWDGD